MGSDIFTVVIVEIGMVLNVTPYSLVDNYKHFGGSVGSIFKVEQSRYRQQVLKEFR
jgi:hypothetical protein